jgi:hypothetical protein
LGRPARRRRRSMNQGVIITATKKENSMAALALAGIGLM